jgi:phospholipid/cholesterol/gamma-HCH transport system ATP-binding protein
VPADHLIRISKLNFAYDERAILNGISMEIPRGKLIAIMGNSGCGKTTLLRLIGGQLKPSSGELFVDGQSVPDMSHSELYAMRRRMGMLFQFGALFTDISVFDNVAYLMREHTDLPEEMIRDMVLMKLNAVGLRGAHALMPSELSGGMARRVALARAIALDPMLIMYDEPFAGLDPISMGVIGKLVRTLSDALGATTLLVTHDVQEAMLIADYAYFISDGQIVTQGTPDEIRASADPFVHQFVFGEADGPVQFHYPAPPFAQELLRDGAYG